MRSDEERMVIDGARRGLLEGFRGIDTFDGVISQCLRVRGLLGLFAREVLEPTAAREQSRQAKRATVEVVALRAIVGELRGKLAQACARITEESDAASLAEAESRALRAEARELRVKIAELEAESRKWLAVAGEDMGLLLRYRRLIDAYVPREVADAALRFRGPDPVQEPTMEQRLETVRRVMASLDPRVEVVNIEPDEHEGWTIVARRGRGTCRLLVLDWTHATIEAECREGLAIINARDVPPKDAVSPAFAPYSVDPDGQG